MGKPQLIKHGTSGLVAMTSASHAEGRQFDPGLVYFVAQPVHRLKTLYVPCGLHIQLGKLLQVAVKVFRLPRFNQAFGGELLTGSSHVPTQT